MIVISHARNRTANSDNDTDDFPKAERQAPLATESSGCQIERDFRVFDAYFFLHT